MISYWKTFRNLSSLLRNLTYLSLLNSFLFLSRFYVSLKSLHNYFFRWFVYKSLLSRFSVLISYNMWSSNHFTISSCFPCFSGPGFSGSRVRGQVLEVAVRDNTFFWLHALLSMSFCYFLCVLVSPTQVTYILCDYIMSERLKIRKSPTN